MKWMFRNPFVKLVVCGLLGLVAVAYILKWYPGKRPNLLKGSKPLDRIVDIPVNNKGSDMCKEWTGSPESAAEWWHWACLLNKYFATLDYSCKQPTNAGNWKICLDEPWRPTQGCIAYSFGIANNFAFDDYMIKTYNCNVYSFDPSMGKQHFRRNAFNLFFNLGLGWENTDLFSPRRDVYVQKEQAWSVRTLKTIIDDLKHSDKIIDVLKIDIELSEWPVLRKLLSESDVLSMVKQFLIEWHIFPDAPAKEDFRRMFYDLNAFRDLGFYAYFNNPYKWINTKDPKQFNSQSEMSYVNMQHMK